MTIIRQYPAVVSVTFAWTRICCRVIRAAGQYLGWLRAWPGRVGGRKHYIQCFDAGRKARIDQSRAAESIANASRSNWRIKFVLK
jgi:hypothetical protein